MFIGSRESRQEAEGAIEAVCLHTGHPRTEELVKKRWEGSGGVLEGSGRGGTPGLPDGVDFDGTAGKSGQVPGPRRTWSRAETPGPPGQRGCTFSICVPAWAATVMDSPSAQPWL